MKKKFIAFVTLLTLSLILSVFLAVGATSADDPVEESGPVLAEMSEADGITIVSGETNVANLATERMGIMSALFILSAIAIVSALEILFTLKDLSVRAIRRALGFPMGGGYHLKLPV